MDLVVVGSEDSLLQSLSFDLPPTTSYVQQRRLVSYYPSGASTFQPDGVNVARFVLIGNGWLDPSSLRITGKLANTHATDALTLADGQHCLSQRIRVCLCGSLVEDVDMYNRNHQFFRRLLMSRGWCENEAIE